MELSDYTNGVLGAVAIVVGLGGQLPSIDTKTGEPRFAGETADYIRNLRLQARVKTFDEAISKCSTGSAGLRMRVANFEKNKFSMWVFSTKDPSRSFWMPTAHADLAK